MSFGTMYSLRSTSNLRGSQSDWGKRKEASFMAISQSFGRRKRKQELRARQKGEIPLRFQNSVFMAGNVGRRQKRQKKRGFVSYELLTLWSVVSLFITDKY